MNNIREYIVSGIIEAYVMGTASMEEMEEVGRMAASYPEIREAINSFSDMLEHFALENAIAPDPTIKPFLMATIDLTERLKNGERLAFPPEISGGSLIADYKEWLDRPDMVLPKDFYDIHAKIIGYTPTITTAIVWIKEMAPQEVHHNEFEKFLVVEGTCDITISGQVHHLSAGNVLTIPLYANHHVTITSKIPCKIILQRVAA